MKVFRESIQKESSVGDFSEGVHLEYYNTSLQYENSVGVFSTSLL